MQRYSPHKQHVPTCPGAGHCHNCHDNHHHAIAPYGFSGGFSSYGDGFGSGKTPFVSNISTPPDAISAPPNEYNIDTNNNKSGFMVETNTMKIILVKTRTEIRWIQIPLQHVKPLYHYPCSTNKPVELCEKKKPTQSPQNECDNDIVDKVLDRKVLKNNKKISLKKRTDIESYYVSSPTNSTNYKSNSNDRNVFYNYNQNRNRQRKRKHDKRSPKKRRVMDEERRKIDVMNNEFESTTQADLLYKEKHKKKLKNAIMTDEDVVKRLLDEDVKERKRKQQLEEQQRADKEYARSLWMKEDNGVDNYNVNKLRKYKNKNKPIKTTQPQQNEYGEYDKFEEYNESYEYDEYDDDNDIVHKVLDRKVLNDEPIEREKENEIKDIELPSKKGNQGMSSSSDDIVILNNEDNIKIEKTSFSDFMVERHKMKSLKQIQLLPKQNKLLVGKQVHVVSVWILILFVVMNFVLFFFLSFFVSLNDIIFV